MRAPATDQGPAAAGGDVVAFPGAAASPPQPSEPEPRDALDEFFRSYHACRSRDEFGAWQRAVFDRVTDLAARVSTRSPYEGSARAPCPLCRSVPSSAYTSRGFTLPEGLDRRLEGRGNTYACPVIEALLTLANQSIEPTLRAADAAEARGAKADATTD